MEQQAGRTLLSGLHSLCRHAIGLASLPLIVLSFILLSCDHKELWSYEPATYDIDVAYDWSLIPDHELPSAMRVLFYPLDADDGRTAPYAFDFTGHDGGKVRLAAGNYRIISYNHDTDNIIIADDADADAIYAVTQPLSKGSPLVNIPDSVIPDGLTLYDSPQWLCRAYEPSAYVSGEDTTTEYIKYPRGRAAVRSASNTITLTPDWAMQTVKFTVHGLKDAGKVLHAEAAVSGLDYDRRLAANYGEGTEIAMPMTLAVQSDSILLGQLNVWGILQNSQPHIFIVFVWAEKGYWHTVVDITEQLKPAWEDSHEHEVNVDLDFKDAKLTPYPNSGGSGFVPTVDDYKEVHETIPII